VSAADGAALKAADIRSLFADLADHPVLILAVSGGPDSTALLVLAARWRKARKRGPKLIAITIDHEPCIGRVSIRTTTPRQLDSKSSLHARLAGIHAGVGGIAPNEIVTRKIRGVLQITWIIALASRYSRGEIDLGGWLQQLNCFGAKS